MDKDLHQHELVLDQIFSRKRSFENPELQKIVDEGYRYCPIQKSAEILIIGINPSLRKNNNHIGGRDFNFIKAINSEDRYFKKFREMFSEVDSSRLGYTDLFYHRRTSQADISLFMRDPEGLKFLCEQLEFTRKKIERVSPKLICVFNRKAAEFFGLHAGLDKNGKPIRVWLGYSFEKTKWTEVKQIQGISGLGGRIGTSNSTNLAPGTLVFFSRFLGNGMSRQQGAHIKETLDQLSYSLRFADAP